MQKSNRIEKKQPKKSIITNVIYIFIYMKFILIRKKDYDENEIINNTFQLFIQFYVTFGFSYYLDFMKNVLAESNRIDQYIHRTIQNIYSTILSTFFRHKNETNKQIKPLKIRNT